MTSTDVPGPVRKALRDGGKLWVARLYRHEILHARTVKGMQIEAMDAWNRIVIKPILRAVASRLSDFDLRGSDVVLDAFPQLRALEQEIRTTAANGAAAVRRLTTERIASLVGNEIDWVAENAKKSLGVVAAKPTTEAVMRAVTEQPFLGEKVEKWFDKMLAQPTGDSARRVVQTGLQRGFTVDEITRLLRGRKETGYTDGALSGTSTRDVQTLVRTAATHASAVSRTESFKLIGVKKWRFVATLDSKTSVQCAANDGTTWPLGEGPLPPLHPNCRSVQVPDFGDPIGDRASIDGPVPADTTFEGWLEGQGVDVQDEVLGKTKAAAWRSGSLTLKQMLGADLEPLTVAELRRLDRIPDEPDDEE